MRFDYPFDEFANHVRAMPVVHEYESARFSYDDDSLPVPVGDSRGEVPTMIRVGDYFSQIYADADERFYKFGRFMKTMCYLAADAEDCREAGLTDGAAVSETVHVSVLRAAHHFFCGEEQVVDVPIATVLAKAAEFRGEDAE